MWSCSQIYKCHLWVHHLTACQFQSNKEKQNWVSKLYILFKSIWTYFWLLKAMKTALHDIIKAWTVLTFPKVVQTIQKWIYFNFVFVFVAGSVLIGCLVLMVIMNPTIQIFRLYCTLHFHYFLYKLTSNKISADAKSIS